MTDLPVSCCVKACPFPVAKHRYVEHPNVNGCFYGQAAWDMDVLDVHRF